MQGRRGGKKAWTWRWTWPSSGAGAAGLYVALCAAREGGRVALISAAPLAQTASYWAQGGLAAALAEDDSPELHLADTERAGQGRGAPGGGRGAGGGGAGVRARPAEAGGALRRRPLRAPGAGPGGGPLGAQGGARGGQRDRPAPAAPALRAGGGRAADRRCSRTCAWGRCGWTEGEERRCGGVVCGPIEDPVVPEDGRTIAARAVVLSTGGAAALWARTTNPPGSQGRACCWRTRAGARLADLEFVQFHPTAVIGVRGREGFLITEAIRGEGATLHDANGERFVDELAPRDEVARAIWARLRETGAESVGLDMRGDRPGAVPQRGGGAARGGGGSHAGACAGGAGGALHDGRDRDGPARALVGGGVVRGGRDVVHRPARGEPAGVELAERVLRVRRVARRASALAEPPRPSGDTRARGAGSGRSASPAASAETRAAMWRDAGIERSAEGLVRLARDPHPLARHDRERARWSAGRAAGRTGGVEHPEADPALERRHVVVGARGRAHVGDVGVRAKCLLRGPNLRVRRPAFTCFNNPLSRALGRGSILSDPRTGLGRFMKIFGPLG